MTTIYLDMDGVIADFWAGLFALCGVCSKEYLPDKHESIQALKGTNFFGTLPDFETSRTLINYVRDYGDWGIITAPLRDDFANCAYWKRIWLERFEYMPEDITKFIVTKKKQVHALNKDGSPNILIDDSDWNIEPWRKKGGIAIKYEALYDDVYELIGKIEETLLKLKVA